MTLDEWAEDCWSLLAVRKRTLADYKGKYRRHIRPTFGSKDVTAITRREIQTWMLGLSPTIGRAVLPILKSLYREALAYDICDRNPTVGIKKKPHIKARREFLTMNELEQIDFGDHTDMFLFLAKHGLRWSEMFNLTATDFVNKSGKTYIRVVRSVDGDVTKGKKERLVPYLGHWRDDYPQNYAWALAKFKARTGGKVIHSLRKTYAYWLKQKGVPMQTAQRLLGHSTIVLTMDLYTDVRDDEIEAAADVLSLT